MLKTVGNPSTRYGDQTIVNGNLVIGTSGKGIDFSANPNPAGMTSELLNDYEEGTFTPFSYGTSSAGAGTYSSQIGKYTKIGNCVYFQIYIVQTAHTGTGNMRIGGLPFSSSSTSNLTPVATVYSDVTLPASTTMQPAVTGNGTFIILYTAPVGGGSLGTVAMDGSCSLIFSGSYVV